MQKLTQEQLEAIRKRAEMATEGPWKLNQDVNGYIYALTPFNVVASVIEYNDDGTEHLTLRNTNHVNNRIFIAEARTDIPALLALIDELYAENSRLCPIGDLDTITTLQTEIAYRDEIIAARDAEVERLRGREKRAEALLMEVRSELVDERLAETEIFTAVDEYLYGGDAE